MKIEDDGLPASGFISLKEAWAYMNISKSTYYAPHNKGRFPKSVGLASRRKGIRVNELRKWEQNPEAYRNQSRAPEDR